MGAGSDMSEVAALSALADYFVKFGLTGGALAVLMALHRGHIITRTHYDEVKAVWERELEDKNKEILRLHTENKEMASLLLRSARVTSQAVGHLTDGAGQAGQ